MKNKLSIEQIEAIGGLFGVIFGSLLHFIYDWTGLVFVGLISAVNESPWEHLKLFYMPVILFLAIEWIFVKDKKTLLLAKVIESIFGIIFIVSFFFTYTGVLGFRNVLIDIASFVVAVVIGKYISYKILTVKIDWQGYAWLHSLVLILLTMLFMVATFLPPQIPLFKDQNSGGYGINHDK